MPIVNYVCTNSECSSVLGKFFKKASDIKSEQVCSKCGGVAKRKLGGPAISSKMEVDNGVGSKSVEIYTNQVEMFQEHSQKGQKRE